MAKYSTLMIPFVIWGILVTFIIVKYCGKNLKYVFNSINTSIDVFFLSLFWASMTISKNIYVNHQRFELTQTNQSKAIIAKINHSLNQNALLWSYVTMKITIPYLSKSDNHWLPSAFSYRPEKAQTCSWESQSKRLVSSSHSSHNASCFEGRSWNHGIWHRLSRGLQKHPWGVGGDADGHWMMSITWSTMSHLGNIQSYRL